MLQSHAKTLKRCNVTITRKNLKKRNWQPAFYSVYCLWGIIFSERSHALWKCFPAPCRCSLNGLFCSLPPLDLFFKNWKAAMTQPPPNLLRKTDNYLQFHFWAPQKRKTAFSAVFLFLIPRSGCGRITVFSLHINSREKSGERHDAKNTVYYTEKQGCRQDTHKCAKMSIRAVPCIIIHLFTYTCQVHLY